MKSSQTTNKTAVNPTVISLEDSSSSSLANTGILINFLKESSFFESETEARSRERILGRLDNLLKEFVKKQSVLRGEHRDCGGKLCTFGSYRLGVHDKGADIDALCVVPRHVSRKDFFSVFYSMLKKESCVVSLSKIEEAYVPLIKIVVSDYEEIPIDLTMARLNLPIISSKLNLLNDSLLKPMDEKCILSLNGSRVTDELLSLVPNKETFHTALRAIKFWAKRRYIYGNTYGFFGGVAFSISVARICQMYPNKCAFDIFEKFFEVYASWDWPNPVVLKPVVDYGYNLKVWDPTKHPCDRYHKMPIITPAYPSMCSTHNITQSTFDLIKKEIQRGCDILQGKLNICDTFDKVNEDGKGKDNDKTAADNINNFLSIFKSTDFFKKYKIFIDVSIEAEEESFKTWEGFVESKIRILGNKLEGVETIDSAIPFPKMFIYSQGVGDDDYCDIKRFKGTNTGTNGLSNDIANKKQAKFFLGIEISKTAAKTKKIYIDSPIKEFLEFINAWVNKTSDMKIEIKSSKKKEVQRFLKDNY